MKKYKVAAITDKVFGDLQSVENCRYPWRDALYYLFIFKLSKAKEDLKWKEWKDKKGNVASGYVTDHHLRANRNKNKSKNRNYIIEGSNNGNIRASVAIKNTTVVKITLSGNIKKDGSSEKFKIILSKDDFEPLVTFKQDGRFIITDLEVDEILSALARIYGKDIKRKDDPKIRAMVELLNSVRSVYKSSANDDKRFFETVVGAAIFYLPHPVNKSFDGYCSLAALNEDIKENRVVKEHKTPRKYAASQELRNEDTANYDHFYEKFVNEYRMFMYLTPKENNRMVNWNEKKHKDYNVALIKNKIEIFPNDGNTLFKNDHTKYRRFVTFCRNKKNGNNDLTMSEAMDLLTEFNKMS